MRFAVFSARALAVVLCLGAAAPASAETVTVKKIVVPAGDTGKFTLQLKTGSGQLLANFLNASGGATMGPVTVPAGAYNVSEVAGLNTNLSNYTAVISGAGCATNGNVLVAGNANIICTITNTHVSNCTGFPLVANVNFYSPAQPFGPQTVDICSGGHVVFHNVSSGAALTITWVSGPTTFPAVPVAAANGSLGLTIVLPTAGNEEYKISGYTLHGHIIVH